MALTPRLSIPYPQEREEPYFDKMKSFFLTNDNILWAVSENGNLVFEGGGLFSWSTATANLTWTEDVSVSGFTSPTQSRALILGPPSPGGTITINDGEVVYFTLPRLLRSDTPVTLVKSTVINQSGGTRMSDLRLFCARIGDTLYFPYGKSIKTGESIILWGGGSNSSISPHVHQPALVIEPGVIGATTLDLQTTYLSDTRLTYSTITGAFSVGETVTGGTSGTTAVVTSTGINFVTVGTTTGAGFQTAELITGNSNLVTINVTTPSGTFNVGDACIAGAATGVIKVVTGSPSPTSFIVKVTSGVFPGSGAFTDTTTSASATITSTSATFNPSATLAIIVYPTNLRKVDLYRNGLLQAEGATYDYTVNYSTGIVTLAIPTVSAAERFVALRESIPITSGSTSHTHSKLAIPIAAPTSVISIISTILDPSPNQLQSMDLYRNGLLQSEPGDYSLDTSTGLATLITAATAGELFIANRQLA